MLSQNIISIASPKQNRSRKSKCFRFRERFTRGVLTESKCENRNPSEEPRRAQPTGRFITMHTRRQSSARHHRSTREASKRGGNSIPGCRRPSHGSGGASNVDAPGSDYNFYSVLGTKNRPRSGGHHPELSSNYVCFGSNAGKRRPENVGVG